MTNKEFQRLSRAQLIEIIYQLQLQLDELTEDNKKLSAALEEKRLRISNAGSIAKAALSLNECFEIAQKAADQYLAEIEALRKETEEEKEKILSDARKEADAIISRAKSVDSNYNAQAKQLKEKEKNSSSGNG